MAVTFTREDLLADMSDQELTKLTTKRVNDGDPDPLVAAIERARETYDLYAGRWLVPDNRQKRLISCLALWEVEQRVSVISPKRQKAYDEAMVELRAIRDGKFPNLAPAESDELPANIVEARGRSGGQPQINTSRH